jgi:GT2 family glycosyltransferase
MSTTTEVAIVILNWNGKKLFSKFLPSVIENSKGDNIEVIVADNGSTDGSVSYLQQNFPSVKIIDLKENFGFAEGYNQALKQVDAKYFVLLNSDVKVAENWIEPCIKQFEADKKIVAIQPKILSYSNPESFEYAGAAGGFIDKFGYPFCRGRILNELEKDENQYNYSTEIFWASGAAMFMRAEAFIDAGGLDGDFFAHMEEIDLCWRLKNQGMKIVYEPQSVVFHLGGGTLSYDSPQKVYLNFRNNLWMLFKNLPKKQFKRTFITRMLLDGLAALKFLAAFNSNGFLAVVKAHAAFYKNLSKLRKKRKEIQQNIKREQHPEMCKKSIMWKFFIQKKRKFSELNFKVK